MTQPAPIDTDAWIDALAPVLGLTVTPEYRPGVKANLEVAIRMARVMDRVPLEDDSEPAPVFTP